MSDLSSPTASAGAPRYGNPASECAGAQMRALCRQLATVVTVEGRIGAANLNLVSQYARRFILREKAYVLDLSRVKSFTTQGISILYAIDEECRAAGVEWALLTSAAVAQRLNIHNDGALLPIADSLPEALEYFADITRSRRRLLPLLSRTA
jgi:anti-anti-sigma regulatory factor